ncbi:MAG: hypothetical protein H6708_03200 [Kofleriaceae bacterium]|nr:hypothetical protein [Kofleriaceae bacterium]
MLFLEDHARLLLVLHTVLAVAAVATSTHLVVWLARVRRGAHGRLRAVRRFAVILAVLHGAAFAAGNLMYPTYKIQVKVGYLQNPDAVVADGAARVRDAAQVRRRFADRDAAPPSDGEVARATAGLPAAADRTARWFDAKEHWVAMGLPLSLALAFVLAAWRPEPGRGGEVGGVIMTLAIGASASLWFAAVIGVLTASARAIG